MLVIIITIIIIFLCFGSTAPKKSAVGKEKKTLKDPQSIYALTPRIDAGQCQECGCVDCMSFAMRVAVDMLSAEQCPRLSDEVLITITGHPRQTTIHSPEKLECPDCHEAVPPDTVYCPHCGCLVKKT